MDRLKQRLEDASRAAAALDAALEIPSPTELERDGAIQRFEFTYEAVWKAGQSFLADHEGLSAPSPRAVMRGLGKVAVFNEAETILALEMSEDRNRTVHT